VGGRATSAPILVNLPPPLASEELQDQRLLARVGSLNATSGQVVPEARTNSLVVSTTAANMAIVEKLLRRLDTPAHPPSTTLVLPLQNARATDVGLLLNQPFNPTSPGYRPNTAAQRSPGSMAGQRPTASPFGANRNPRGLTPR
jgi:type II secretory pathway component GspD/PulD (secretin)